MKRRSIKMLNEFMDEGFKMDEAIELVKIEMLVKAISKIEDELSDLNKNINALKSTIHERE